MGMAVAPVLFSFSSFLMIIFLSFPCSSLSKVSKITILPPFTSNLQNLEPWQRINQLAAASRSRARHIKRGKSNNTCTPTKTNVCLFPRSDSEYHISLCFGTPPQTLSFIFDTGSSETWFPCTNHYQCTECDSHGINPGKISTFLPRLSSSATIVGCKSLNCGRILGPDVQPSCRDCDDKSQNCIETCPYSIQYGSGSTSGILLSEILRFPNKNVENFVVGCSTQTTTVSAGNGIAGFGREPGSLPAQLALKKFSYCLVPHNFDDTQKSSELVMVDYDDSNIISPPSRQVSLSYTPFGKPPSGYESFYYINIEKITVGGVDVEVPTRFLVPGPSGMGGTIVDSGTAITTVDNEVYELVAREFEKQMQYYRRAPEVENQAGIGPCYNLSGEKLVNFPELAFHLVGGAKMEFPMSDNLEVEPEVFCLAILPGEMEIFGPSIILGNRHQQNFYMEFDLENDRLGFRSQIC